MRKRAVAGELIKNLAADYGISVSRASAICGGSGWRHIWPYFDRESGWQQKTQNDRRKEGRKRWSRAKREA